MKGKKRLIALLLSFLMVLSQMSVATFALDTVADENSEQTVEEQAVEETQPEAELKVAAAETEPAAEETAAAETATESESAQPAAAEPAKAEPAKAEEKKTEPAKAEEKKAEAREEAFDQSQTVDGVTVNVSAAKGVFPAGSKLSVSKVAVPGAVDTSDAEAAYAFDISILANGQKIQPDGNATVSFTTSEVAGYDTTVYHMDGGAQKMSVSESGETATVTTSGFSVYVIEFTDKWTGQTSGTYSGTVEQSVGEEIPLANMVKAPKDNHKNYKRIGQLGDPSDPAVIQVITPDEGVQKDVGNVKVKALKEGTATLVVKMSGSAYDSSDTAFTHTFTIKVNTNYEVSFDPGEAAEDPTFDPTTMPETQKVAPDDPATEPDDPEWTDHEFDGWYLGDEEFNFDTPITEDTVLVAHWTHPWKFVRESNNFVGKVYCTATDCPYNSGFEIAINAYDVYHRDKVEVTVDGPTPKEGYPDDKYKIGEIQYYEGEITNETDFDGKTPVSFDKVNSTEGDYTARVMIGTANIDGPRSLFKSFQVVSAGPIAAEGLVYKDGRCVVADDDMSPEGTSAIVLYKHPTTGKYVRREKLLNDGSIPIGETKIDYIVLPNDDYDPDDPEEYQIGYGEVTIDIAGRMFTISYDLNGGKLNGQTGVVTTKVEEGTVITLPSPTRSGYKFDYWEGSKYNAGDKYTVTGDHTFKAVWKANSKGVNTGDSNDIAGLMALMIASIGALGAIGYRRRKEDQ